MSNFITSEVVPVVSLTIAEQIIPKVTISNTDAVLTNQGKTFNEAGHTFNQAGDVFEGITGRNQDILPLTITFTDLYGSSLPPLNAGMPYGLLLALTYPVKVVQ